MKYFNAWVQKVGDLSKAEKGDLFEELCKHALLFRCYKHVWRLKDVPESVKQHLGLTKQDFGIDLVAQDNADAYHAVQAKFRIRGRVAWRDVATFDALVTRTGPWSSHIVMSNASRVRRIGRRNDKDKSFCAGSWHSLPAEFWLNVAQLKGNALGSSCQLNDENMQADNQVVAPAESERQRVARLRLLKFK